MRGRASPSDDPELDAEVLRAASVTSSGGYVVRYPTTPVHVLIGDENQGPDPVAGRLWMDGVVAEPGNQAVVHVLAGGIPHEIQETWAGATFLRDALLGLPLSDPAYDLVDDGGVTVGWGCVDRDGG